MGVTREAIAQFVRGAQKRILKVYERWTEEEEEEEEVK